MLPSASVLAYRREERVQKAFSGDHHGHGDAGLRARATPSQRPKMRLCGALWGTPRAPAVVTSTPRSVYHQPVSRGQPSGLQTPTVPLKITNCIDFGPIWGPFKVPHQRCGPMGCALGHRSSSVRRTGTIYGGPDTSHELSFDTCHQRGHQVKSC